MYIYLFIYLEELFQMGQRWTGGPGPLDVTIREWLSIEKVAHVVPFETSVVLNQYFYLFIFNIQKFNREQVDQLTKSKNSPVSVDFLCL